MADNNNSIFGLVRIEISQMYYDQFVYLAQYSPELQDFLTCARVVEGDTPKKESELTDEVLKRLFGANYKHVCIYDNETRRLLTRKYNDFDVYWDYDSTRNSKDLKKLFDKAFPKFELVAQATMQVSKEDYPGYATWSNREVKFNKKGEYVVGSLIIRNKEISKLELFNSGAWFGVAGRWYLWDAARDGARGLPDYAVEYPDFRAALLSGRGQR